MPELSDDNTETLVPVRFDGHTVYIAARDVDGESDSSGDEHPIASREARFERVLDSIAGFAHQVATRLGTAEASKVTVQFGCEIAVESGSFVAVIGKASSKSTMTVSLEWTTSPT
ncbi:CU044_2847 family protein [Nonomuraea fuscirosea]|uniref:CU044_2847 family protein n=1 Tax=Nonomuraea fuscirosea TaxID=1291556 RepID=UPI00341AF420